METKKRVPPPAKDGRFGAREEGGVVGGERCRVSVLEGPVGKRCEVAAPRLDRTEQRRVAKRDVERAVAARRETGEHTACRCRDRREVCVDPRDNVHDGGLPLARPFAVVGGLCARCRDHRDERPQRSRCDLCVRERSELRSVRVLRRRSRHSVQQVDDRVVRCRVEAWRKIDVAGAHRSGKVALQELSATWLGRSDCKAWQGECRKQRCENCHRMRN